jgi:hypothetical protein
MAIAAERDLDLEHYDIKTAFLIPDIKFKQYASMPPGFLQMLPEIIQDIEKTSEHAEFSFRKQIVETWKDKYPVQPLLKIDDL